MINTLFIPLLSTSFTHAFAAMRANAISSSGKIVALSFTIGSMLLVAKMIKIAYNVISDEQQGGFGGVSLKDIVIPVLMLFGVYSSGAIVSATEWTTDYVFGNLARQFDYSQQEQQQKNKLKEYDKLIEKAKKDLGNTLHIPKDIQEKKKQKSNWFQEQFNDFFATLGETVGRGALTIITWLINWFVGIGGTIIISAGQLMLCLLTMFFPFSMALGVMDCWRKNILTIIGAYIQVSLWTPLVMAVQFMGASMKCAIYQAHVDVGTGQIDLTGLGADLWASALISAATLLIVVNVPSIAQSIVSAIGNEGSAVNGVGQSGHGVAAGLFGFTGAALFAGTMFAGKKIGTSVWGKINGVGQAMDAGSDTGGNTGGSIKTGGGAGGSVNTGGSVK